MYVNKWPRKTTAEAEAKAKATATSKANAKAKAQGQGRAGAVEAAGTAIQPAYGTYR